LARLAQTSSPSPDPMPRKDLFLPADMRRQEFRAMGTTIELLLPQRQIVQGGEAVRLLFAYWEQTLSRFQADSELCSISWCV
jgi:hypothetical protein